MEAGFSIRVSWSFVRIYGGAFGPRRGEAAAEGEVKVHPGVEAEPLNLQELAFGTEGVALGGEKGDDSIKAAGIAVLRQVAGGLGLFYGA